MRGKPVQLGPSVDQLLLARRYTRRALLRRGAVSAAAAGTGILGLSLVGCGAGDKGKHTASSGQTGASATTLPTAKVTVSYDGTPSDVPLFLAGDQGIFAKHGLDVTLVQIPGPTSVAAVLSGQVQVGHPGDRSFWARRCKEGTWRSLGCCRPCSPC